MNKQEFEQFVIKDGKDILRFCRMNAGDTESGNELYHVSGYNADVAGKAE